MDLINPTATEPTQNAPLEVPSWHLEFPLRWPQISFAIPESVRAYSFRPHIVTSAKPRDPILPAKAKRKQKARRRRKAQRRLS